MSVYYDYPVAKVAGKVSLAEQLVASSSATVKAAAKSGVVDQALFESLPETKPAGKMSVGDSHVMTVADTTKAAGSSSVVSRGLMRDVATPAKGADKSTLVDQFLVQDLPDAKGAIKSYDWADLVEHIDAKAGAKASVVDQLIAQDLVYPKGAFSGGGTTQGIQSVEVAAKGAGSTGASAPAVMRSSPGAKGAMSSSQAPANVYRENVNAALGGKGVTAEQLIGAYAPVVKLSGGFGGYGQVNFQCSNLIDAVRAKVKACLGEATSIPEALSTVRFGRDLPSTYVVILAQDTYPDPSYAVNDAAIRVPIDLLYVTRLIGDSTTDTPQQARRRMDALIGALMADWKMGGITTGVEVMSVPMERMTSYQDFLAQQAQGNVVMSVCVEYLVIESLVGA